MDNETNIPIADYAINVLSLVCGLVFCVSLVLQTVKILKTRSAKDLSYGWAVLAFLSICGGLIYGIYFNLWPIYVANGIQAVLSFTIILLKGWFDFTKLNYVFSQGS